MNAQRVGIIHPGDMGISIAASAKNSGCQVYWASQGRSSSTKERVAKIGLEDAETVAGLCAKSAIVISVCPPHAAEDVANEVIHAGFHGLFVDANAIAPQRTEKIAAMMSTADIAFVDGGIIGFPAWTPHTTCLYLSGPPSQEVAACFSAGPLDTKVLGPEIGKASALKMCYAANTKGTVALLAAILATAEQLGVRGALVEQWAHDDADLPASIEKRVRMNAPKAWRFVGEMHEISRTFEEAGTPGGFHASAAEIYSRLSQFKDARTLPTLDEMVAAMLDQVRAK